MYGLTGSRDQAFVSSVVSKVVVPPFAPKSGLKIETDEKKAAEAKNQVVVTGA